MREKLETPTVQPPWREITTDDYMPRSYRNDIGGAAWIASCERLQGLLERQRAGEFRLRLVMRQAVDFVRTTSRDPSSFWHYNHGPDLVLSVAEIVIQTRDGQRLRVELDEARVDAFTALMRRA